MEKKGFQIFMLTIRSFGELPLNVLYKYPISLMAYSRKQGLLKKIDPVNSDLRWKCGALHNTMNTMWKFEIKLLKQQLRKKMSYLNNENESKEKKRKNAIRYISFMH